MFNFKRQAMGNLGLTIFLAFFFSLFANIGNAAALNLEQGTPDPGEKYNLLYFYSSDADEFQSFAEVLVDKLSHYKKKNYVSGVTDVKYTQAYDNVYQQLGYLVYLVYDGHGKPGTLDTIDLGVYTNVYNDLSLTSQWDRTIWVKPKGNGGGGHGGGGGGGNGGGGGSQDGIKTIETSTGTVTVDTKSGKATLVVDHSKIKGQLDNSALKTVLVEIPSNASIDVDKLQVELSADVVNSLKGAGKDLVIKMGGVTVQIPRSVIEGISLNAGEKLVIKVGKPKVDVKKPNGGEIVSPVFDIAIDAVSGDQVRAITSFNGRIALTLPIDLDKKSGRDSNRFGVYKLVKQDFGGYRFIPVGGKVNPDSTITVYRDSLSLFTVVYQKRTFADTGNHWGREYIELMASREICKGLTEDLFGPDQSVTRAQFTAFLQRALGLEELDAQVVAYSDVKPGSWYYGSIQAAAKAGLLKGFEGEAFRPDALITRQEMATMIANALKSSLQSAGLSADEIKEQLAMFPDQGSIADGAKESVAIAAKAGIIKGRGDGFAPEALATRAEGMVMLKNLLTKLDWL